MTGSNTLSDEALVDLSRMKRKTIGTQPSQNRVSGEGHAPSRMFCRGKLASSMSAGSLASPTAFTWNKWIPDPESASDPVPFIVSPDSDELAIAGVNRKSATGNTGDEIEVEFNNGEWCFRDKNCPT